jgi:hypothetical protein
MLECHNLGWMDNPSTLRRNVTVVKCDSRRFVGETLSLGQNVMWSVRGWMDHQCTYISRPLLSQVRGMPGTKRRRPYTPRLGTVISVFECRLLTYILPSEIVCSPFSLVATGTLFIANIICHHEKSSDIGL